MSKYMYRVSSELTDTQRVDGVTVITQVLRQCGCFYYFEDITNAQRAMSEFNTSIDVMVHRAHTCFSDDWYIGVA